MECQNIASSMRVAVLLVENVAGLNVIKFTIEIIKK